MPVSKSKFQSLATELVNETFADFRDTLVMRAVDDPVYGSPPTYTKTETGTAIPLSLDFGMFESQMIEVGDFMLVTDAAQWTIDPEISGVDLIFGGTFWTATNLSIIQAEKDAANAAYFIKVRKK